MNNTMLFAVLLLAPLVGFLFNGLRFKSKNYLLAGSVATAAVGLSFACALLLVMQLFGAQAVPKVEVKFFDWINVGALEVTASFVIDHISAIMVLVVFVIMLLNLDDDKPLNRLRYLYAVGGGLGLILLVQTFFIFYAVMRAPKQAVDENVTVGKTLSIGSGMYTEYLLPIIAIKSTHKSRIQILR